MHSVVITEFSPVSIYIVCLITFGWLSLNHYFGLPEGLSLTSKTAIILQQYANRKLGSVFQVPRINLSFDFDGSMRACLPDKLLQPWYFIISTILRTFFRSDSFISIEISWKRCPMRQSPPKWATKINDRLVVGLDRCVMAQRFDRDCWIVVLNLCSGACAAIQLLSSNKKLYESPQWLFKDGWAVAGVFMTNIDAHSKCVRVCIRYFSTYKHKCMYDRAYSTRSMDCSDRTNFKNVETNKCTDCLLRTGLSRINIDTQA